MIFIVRRISDKALFGIVDCPKELLFQTIDEEADPFGFEYTNMKFKYTGNNGVDTWLRFDTTQRLNIQVKE